MSTAFNPRTFFSSMNAAIDRDDSEALLSLLESLPSNADPLKLLTLGIDSWRTFKTSNASGEHSHKTTRSFALYCLAGDNLDVLEAVLHGFGRRAWPNHPQLRGYPISLDELTQRSESGNAKKTTAPSLLRAAHTQSSLKGVEIAIAHDPLLAERFVVSTPISLTRGQTRDVVMSPVFGFLQKAADSTFIAVRVKLLLCAERLLDAGLPVQMPAADLRKVSASVLAERPEVHVATSSNGAAYALFQGSWTDGDGPHRERLVRRLVATGDLDLTAPAKLTIDVEDPIVDSIPGPILSRALMNGCAYSAAVLIECGADLGAALASFDHEVFYKERPPHASAEGDHRFLFGHPQDDPADRVIKILQSQSGDNRHVARIREHFTRAAITSATRDLTTQEQSAPLAPVAPSRPRRTL